jgi:hypothetical protein
MWNITSLSLFIYEIWTFKVYIYFLGHSELNGFREIVCLWTGFSWLRVDPVVWLFEHGSETRFVWNHIIVHLLSKSKCLKKLHFRSWSNSISTVSDYRLDDRGSVPGRSKGQPPCLDQVWGPPSLRSSGYRGPFLEENCRRGVTLTQEWVETVPPVPLSTCLA